MSKIILWILGGILLLLLGFFAAIYIISGGPVHYVDEAANEELEARFGEISVTVYPTRIRSGPDEERFDLMSAIEISSMLSDRGMTAELSSTEPAPLESVRHANQQRVAMGTAESLAEFVKTQSITTDYALMAEYFVGDEAAHAMHYYWITPGGVIAEAATINSHYKVFRDVDPKNIEDCTEVVLRQLELWIEEHGG